MATRDSHTVRLYPRLKLVGALPWFELDQQIEQSTLTPSAWYSADSLGLAPGAAVTQWTDLSGNARHLTGTATMRRSGQALNGWPALEFNGSSNELASAAAFSAMLADNSTTTMLGQVHCAILPTADANGTIWAQNGGWRRVEYISASKTFRGHSYDGSDDQGDKVVVDPLVPMVLSWRYDDSAPLGVGTLKMFLSLDETPGSSASGVQTNTTGVLYVGSANGSSFFTGRIAELIVVPKPGDTDQAVRGYSNPFRRYLRQKYGIAPRGLYVPGGSNLGTRQVWKAPYRSIRQMLTQDPNTVTDTLAQLLVDGEGLALQASAADVAAGDDRYFVDYAGGYVYFSLHADASGLFYLAPWHFNIQLEYEITFHESSDGDRTDPRALGIGPFPEAAADYLNFNQPAQQLELRLGNADLLFTETAHYLDWKDSRAEVEVTAEGAPSEGADTVELETTIADMMPEEGEARLALKLPGLNLSAPVPPHLYTPIVWPFAESGIINRAVPIGQAGNGIPIEVTPDLVSQGQATPMDIAGAATDFAFWLDPAALLRSRQPGPILSIGNKALDLPLTGGNRYLAVTHDSTTNPSAGGEILLQENVLNGYPALYFAGGSHSSGTDTPYLKTTVARGVNGRLLVFVVFKLDADYALEGGVADFIELFETDVTVGTSTGNRHNLRISVLTKLLTARYRDNAGAAHVTTGFGLQPEKWYIGCYQLNRTGVTVGCGLNDADTAALRTAAATSTEAVTLHFTIGKGMKGHIAEAIVLDASSSATDFTEDQRRRLSRYLKRKFNVSGEATADPTFKTYGTYQICEGGDYSGTRHFMDLRGLSVQTVTAVERETGDETELTVGTDYLAYAGESGTGGCFISIRNSTYAATTHYIRATIHGAKTYQGALAYLANPGKHDVSMMVATLLLEYAGLRQLVDFEHFDTGGHVAAAAEYTPAPVWLDTQRAVRDVLAGGDIGGPGLLQSIIAGLSNFGVAPKLRLLDPGDLTLHGGGLPTIVRKSDIEVLRSIPQDISPPAKIRLYHSPRFNRDETAWKLLEVVNPAAPPVSKDVLEVYVFLQEPAVPVTVGDEAPAAWNILPRTSADSLARRILLLAGAKRSDYDTDLAFLLALDALPTFTPVLLVHDPFTESSSLTRPLVLGDGTGPSTLFPGAPMLVEARRTQLAPTLQRGATLSNVRGLGAIVQQWDPSQGADVGGTDTYQADYWDGANPLLGYWVNDDDLADPTDPLSKRIRGWI